MLTLYLISTLSIDGEVVSISDATSDLNAHG